MRNYLIIPIIIIIYIILSIIVIINIIYIFCIFISSMIIPIITIIQTWNAFAVLIFIANYHWQNHEQSICISTSNDSGGGGHDKEVAGYIKSLHTVG